MNTSDLLEQLLRSGASNQSGNPSSNPSGPSAGGLGDLLGGLLGGGSTGTRGGGLGDLLGSMLGGAGGAGGRAPGGTRTGGMNYAALASLGMMAFQAYQAWQRQQQTAAPQAALQTVDQLAGPRVADHSHAILRALIGAAKADGRIDEQEQQLIAEEMARHTEDTQLQQWLADEAARPLDATDVASAAEDPAMAAEMYLASVMLVDDQQPAERAYLNELATALKIEPSLQMHLEQQASTR